MADVPGNAVRVRFAPSPTGPLHVGGVRTALFNWLFARRYGGTFILRIEDTDKTRSEARHEQDIFDGLSWLGLDWDEGPLTNGNRLPVASDKGAYGPYRQSERTALYRKYLEALMAKGDAYYCYCTKDELEAQREAAASQGLPPKYSGHCRAHAAPPTGKKPEVIRFRIPEVKVEFKDLARGKVVFDAALFGDIAIAKDLDTPLYNFAVVVDDELMKITHVIRGEDHLSNTPKQILMQRALGFREPFYAHIPLILNPDRSKMSKRFSDTTLASYREKGYLPAALVNFLALLGWHPKGDREVMSVKELIGAFDLERIQPAGAVFNEEKLNWLDREHLKVFDDGEIATLVTPFAEKEGFHADRGFLERMVAVERTRANTLRDFIDGGRFFFAIPAYEADLLVWRESTPDEARAALTRVKDGLALISADAFYAEDLRGAVSAAVGDRKRGVVLWPLRVALSGLRASPDPIEIMGVLGREESLRRIETAILRLPSDGSTIKA